MSTDAEIAAAFFPSMTNPGATKPAEKAAASGQPSEEEAAGQRLFSSMRDGTVKVAAHAAESSEPHPADVLFGSAALDQITFKADVPAAFQSEWRATLKHARFDPAMAQHVTDLLQSHYGRAPSAEQQAAWLRERDEYVKGLGADGAYRVALARELVASDSFLSEAIQKSGLGDHPQLLQTIVTHAWSLKASGRW